MMRVAPRNPPGDYTGKVLTPGTAFLAITPAPKGADWIGHEYWREIKPNLHGQYQGVCNYCASWTPRANSSVDHFKPKSKYPGQAYVWNNFRLARKRLNQFKDNFEDVLDPQAIQDNWFELNFSTFMLHPANALVGPQRQQVLDTISRLRLNTDNNLIGERANVLYRYSAGKLHFAYVQRCYPFIARQMNVQKFDQVFRPIYVKILAAKPWLAN